MNRIKRAAERVTRTVTGTPTDNTDTATGNQQQVTKSSTQAVGSNGDGDHAGAAAASTAGSADRGRADLYAAEHAAFAGTTLEEVVPFEELERLANTITAADWWPCGPIPIVPARRDARSSTTNWRRLPGSTPTIRLAPPQQTRATLAHELAHALAGLKCGHGPNFRRAYVDIVGYALGPEPADWLRAALSDARLAIGERTWPTPPAGASSSARSGGEVIAL